MSNKRLSALALVAAIISSSCTTVQTETFYVQEPLPIPERQRLPKIPAEALECLSSEAFETLVNRDVMQDAHIKRLEAIIRTTHRGR